MSNKFMNEEELSRLVEQEIFEDCFMEDVQSLPEDVRKEYLESEEAVMLEAKRLINGKTRIRMSKSDDLARRTNLGSLAIAREKGDPEYKKFIFFRVKMKLAKKKIIAKYGSKAQKAAKLSQKQYLKKAPVLASLKNKLTNNK